ncbi:MAG: HlyD family efflux transporter periplasmic adaptor subunit [Coriobacteriia bacterium]|nr:HlyD family efflux transporter periplasmic adaptor subunit [Coriobacteriia bacterium]
MRFRTAIISLTIIGVCTALCGCTPADTIAVTGSVSSGVVVLQVPALVTVVPDLDAGFAGGGATGSASAGTAGVSRSAIATVSAITGLGSYLRVASIEANPGANVKAGQIIARFDSASLEANVGVASANANVAAAQVGVLDSAIEKTSSSAADLDAARATLESTIDQLTTSRSQLSVQLAQTQAALASLPTSPAPPQAAQLQAAIMQLQAGISQMDAGLVQARAGLGTLDAGSAALVAARAQMRDLRAIAVVASDASKIGVLVAQYQLSLSVVRSPVDGVLVGVADVGDLLAPGATVAAVREDAPAKVTTWLAADQLARVRVGDSATVSGDWMAAGASVTGTVSHIGSRADYPPTSFATDAVHLTRAVPVEITIPSAVLPYGAPVDIAVVPSG